MAALAIAEFGLLIWATRKWLGFGEPLETLNRVRYAWFVFCMPLMWVICAATLANAGFGWAQHRWVVPVLLVVTALILLFTRRWPLPR